MKKLTQIALLGALGWVLAGTGAYAQTEAAEQAPPSAPAGAPPGFGPGQLLLGVIDQYDANKDGALDQTELAALKKDIAEGNLAPPPGGRGPHGFGAGPGPLPPEVLEKYDTNQDGKLDPNERAALRQDVQEGKVQPPAFGARSRGAGGPPADPAAAARDILRKFDANKDGMLDEAELTAFLKEHRPPPGRRGLGGP